MSATLEHSSDTPGCYHCGAGVPRGAPWRITLDGEPRPLCCPGCEAVAHAIVDGGLASYYRFRTQLPARPDDRQAARAETWAVFDDPELQRQFVHRVPGDAVDDSRVQATFAVDGITCAACAWLIEHRLNDLDGLESSAVNLSHHRLHLIWDPTRLALSRILSELAAIGYPTQPYEPNIAQQKLQRDERQAIRRLIVAGVAMMQVMMFSIPLYVAGPDGIGEGFQQLFHWLSLTLSTAVVTFSAVPFFRGALRDLRVRHLGMDVPVAIAILGAYLASAYAVLIGSNETYFDSVTMFTFFLLFSRYIEMRARRRNGHSGNAMTGVLPASATRLEADGSERIVPANHLRPGDRVLVRPGHGVPADGMIVSGQASLDESMLSGESLPIARSVGDSVTGGSLNTDSPLTIEVTRSGRDARAAGILELSDRAFASRPKIAEQASRMAHHFVLRVLIATIGVAIVWSFIDPSRVLWVTLSVLVVTCPCALALATPTALTASHGQLRRRGVLITRAHAIEGLSQATRVVFDKTGTLTEGRMRLRETRPLADGLSAQRARELAATLEAHSEHPIARAFRDHREPRLSACEVRNHPGQGLEGVIDEHRYRLGRADFCMATPPAEPEQRGQWLLLSRYEPGDATPLAWFRLDDALREDAHATIAALRQAGLEVELLSGDGRNAVAALADEVGITTWTAGATPEDKLARIQALQADGEQVVMVGDGINDVPVLAAADVSVAMNGATDLARTRADGVLMSPRLWRIVEAVQLARLTRRLIRQNLTWALCYNLCALPLAALGLVPPWAAALGMSASSLVVVGNALRLNRTRLPATRSPLAEST
ncbi:Cu2+-exporting ATPase [Modicisalibacter muralis]|uniref:Cu2+-exporting ATPase n=1 Tax=Modicisalibacter muralis TaxID=119000 RepID=A0A1G9IY69_9GAMM|nr:heavy metal translocating P-type ATPase [Halomonas muralis]SDL29903.1 Cu2+-exporting ATPase [Halomonas muralis]